MNPSPSVYIVDDDSGMRKSLEFVMQAANLPARFFASAAEFLAAYRPEEGGCLILDLRMPEMTGMELLEHLRQKKVILPIIVVTGHADVPAAVNSMKLGVVDFLEKPVDPQTLVARVHEALRLDTEHRRQQADQAGMQQRLAGLTNRERDLLKLLVRGNSNKEIAAQLGISIKTVANHRAHLLAKTQALNTADLVRISVLAGVS